MRYYVIAGEKSGDLHGAGLCREIKRAEPASEIRGIGGEEMAATGVSLLFHYRELAVMGFTEVIGSLFKFRNYLRQVKQDLKQFAPVAVILIDSAGFNLPMARFVQGKLGIAVFYFIPPKTWAWGPWRNATLRKHVKHLFVTLPFERNYYTRARIPVSYHGSPVLDNLDLGSRDANTLSGHVALLPGSRKSEIRRHLPLMIKVAAQFPEVRFLIGGIRSVSEVVYDVGPLPGNVVIEWDRTATVLKQAAVAVVVSGTASLEAGCFEVPQVVVYRTGTINYLLARSLIRVRHISLVNLILGRTLVREMIQGQCTAMKVGEELDRLMTDQVYREGMINGYREMKSLITGKNAYQQIANEILELSDPKLP